MNTPLFSIIVPIYNVEKYLSKCLESISNQTFKDFEAILVIDGSKDKSEEIATGFAKKDNRYKVINQSNSGQGLARTTGVNNSIGKYIICVDSDDYIDIDYLEKINNILIKNNYPEVVCLNHQENDSKTITHPYFDNRLLNKEEIVKLIYPNVLRDSHYTYFTPTVWAKAIKRELFKKYTIENRIDVGEDGALIVPIITNINSLYLSKEVGYHYRVSEGSTINVKKPRKYQDIYNISTHLNKHLDLTKYDFKMQLYRYIAHLSFNCSITQFYSDKSLKEIKKIILDNLSNPIILEAINNIDAKGIKGKLMRYALKHKSIFLMKIYSKIM